MDPKVSVIIPTYNAQHFVENAINSVIDQDYDNIEILVIDDDSTDSTVNIVKNLQQRYSQIILLSNTRSFGPSGTRNSGLLRASGEYISFLDADDIWLPGHLRSGINFLENNSDIDVIFFNFNVVDAVTGEILFDWFSRKQFAKFLRPVPINEGYFLLRGDIFTGLLKESFFHLQSTILRKHMCGKVLFNEKVSYSEDTDFGIRLYLDAKATFAFKNIITSLYYRHVNSLTANSIENNINLDKDRIFLLREYLNTRDANPHQANIIRKKLYTQYLELAYSYRHSCRFKKALHSVLYSAKYDCGIHQIVETLKIFVSLFIHLFTRRPQGFAADR